MCLWGHLWGHPYLSLLGMAYGSCGARVTVRIASATGSAPEAVVRKPTTSACSCARVPDIVHEVTVWSQIAARVGDGK